MSRGMFMVLTGLACAQLLGLAIGSEVLIGLAAASTASPAPKVFTSRNGLESFSSEYWITVFDARGQRDVRVDARRYARLRGPYNRRNPYGAALAFGPVLALSPRTRAALMSVARHGLCGPAPLLVELGIDTRGLAPTRILKQVTRPGTRVDFPLAIEVHCDER